MDLILALYDDILEASGGVRGVRDEGLLVSALNRPVHRFHYEGCRDLIELAATYATAISGNHPFIDGNKRVAFVAMGQFLEDNGLRLVADEDDATGMMFAVASGATDLETLVSWLRREVQIA
ncbi:MAG: type II toxin-antitoxin system death-on-curing family toxin [Phenylobacterium sp.]|uniref:type II toxin-antitoxin system death-on-curing family toxin n=1 Tax=Phenylobacterium sp. TaxID=1871053 RepID=UPI002724E635|nr:type II toxin-antitoxin system death-on-curing family toxin [Phenylobacterium sp.]MDO8901125.1 type II toxin-antitoxin system death-on-curing family toxin [Phenylobacterium sp.]MDP2214351.1 type II toxin-antitoxin system death-on-curing family toxin [Phenylobacterium sp.]